MSGYDKNYYNCDRFPVPLDLAEMNPKYLGDTFSETIFIEKREEVEPVPQNISPFLFPGYTALHYKMIFNVSTYYAMEVQTNGIRNIHRGRWLGEKEKFNVEMSVAFDRYVELFANAIMGQVIKIWKVMIGENKSERKYRLFKKYFYTAAINLRRMGMLRVLDEVYRQQCERDGLLLAGEYLVYDVFPLHGNGNIELWTDFWYDAIQVYVFWCSERESMDLEGSSDIMMNTSDDGI